MTESASEKLIAELGEAMDSKCEELESENIADLRTFIERSLILRAALQDVHASSRGDVPNSAYALQQIRSSEEALNEYYRGKSQDISNPPGEKGDDMSQVVARLFSNHPPFDAVAYPPMIRMASGTTDSERRYQASLQQDLIHADVQDHIMAFLWGERMRRAAQKLLDDSLRNILTRGLEMSVNGSPEAFWRLIITGVDAQGKKIRDGLSFLHGFIERMNAISQESAWALYGDQAERALFLWSAILSVQGKVTPPFKKFRQECASALAFHRYNDAEKLLARFIRENPFSFSQKKRSYINEHVSAPPESEPQKTVIVQSELKKRFEEQLSEVEPFIGRTFVRRGGSRIRIVRSGPDIRSGHAGSRPGVEIAHLRKNPLGKEVVIKTEIILPSTFLKQIKDHMWTIEEKAE